MRAITLQQAANMACRLCNASHVAIDESRLVYMFSNKPVLTKCDITGEMHWVGPEKRLIYWVPIVHKMSEDPEKNIRKGRR